MRSVCLVMFAVALLGPAAAAQQRLTLSIASGRATLIADDVPLREILARWAEVSGAAIVNLDKVTSAPATLQLIDVPERAALGTLLRAVDGYVLGQKAGTGAIDRILILVSDKRPPSTDRVVGGDTIAAGQETPQRFGGGQRVPGVVSGDAEAALFGGPSPTGPSYIIRSEPAPTPAASRPTSAPSALPPAAGPVVGSTRPGVITASPAGPELPPEAPVIVRPDLPSPIMRPRPPEEP